MLSEMPGRKINKCLNDYVVFDLETTGISPYKDEVVEISAIKVVDKKTVEEFSTLVNPGIPIPYNASIVNNITDDMVKDAPYFEDVLKDFIDFIGDHTLVGHNIHTFDMKFIYRDTKKYFGQTIDNDYIDTLPMSVACLPDLSHHRLSDLAMYYGIDIKGAHRALADCRMNREVYEKLTEIILNNNNDCKARICPICGNMLKLRKGRYGEFLGCMGYPLCRYTENV